MQHMKNIKNKIMCALGILLCFTLASAWLVSHMYARYATGETGSDEARIAIFGNSESITMTDFPKNWKPGMSREYKIIISNQKNGRISEVAQEYDIEIETQGNLPLEYELKKDDNTMVGKFSESSNEASHTFKNNDMEFQASQDREDTYQLVITWPEEKNEESFMGIPDTVRININVNQID